MFLALILSTNIFTEPHLYIFIYIYILFFHYEYYDNAIIYYYLFL